MRCGRREHVACVERARDVGQPVARLGELVRGFDPELVGREHQEAVVGTDERPAVARADRDRVTGAADVWIHDREVHADRHVRNRVAQYERALEHRLRRDSVRDVDHARLGGDAGDHAVARADELVLEPEVGEEGDHRHRVDFIRSATAPTSPSRSCDDGLGYDGEPDRAGDARRLRADADGRRTATDGGVCAGGRARGEHDGVAGGRVRRKQPGSIERDEVGAELVDRPAPRTLGGGEENAAGRTRELAQQAVLRRLHRHERRLDPLRAQHLGRTRADRRDRRQVPRRGARSPRRRSGS